MEVKKGSSVIELTVVIGLVSLLALAMSAIMLTTLTSSNRIRKLGKLKHAGDYALNQMQIMIRNSLNLNVCNPDLDLVTLRNQDGGVTNLFLENDQIASNSGSYLTPSDITVANFDFSCEPDSTNPSRVKTSFDLSFVVESGRASENPSIHFETTTSIRND